MERSTRRVDAIPPVSLRNSAINFRGATLRRVSDGRSADYSVSLGDGGPMTSRFVDRSINLFTGRNTDRSIRAKDDRYLSSSCSFSLLRVTFTELYAWCSQNGIFLKDCNKGRNILRYIAICTYSQDTRNIQSRAFITTQVQKTRKRTKIQNFYEIAVRYARAEAGDITLECVSLLRRRCEFSIFVLSDENEMGYKTQ